MKGGGLLVAVALLTAVIGLPGGFVWDDHALIGRFISLSDGPQVGEALTEPFWRDAHRGGQAAGYYRPVVSLSYVAEYALFGRTPLGYRLSNLLMHLVCIVLAFRFIRRRFAGAGAGYALLATLPFVVHPSRVESAGWISGRTDLWMVAALLLCVELAARRAHGAVLALLAGLAVFCKEAAVVLPALLWMDGWAGVDGGGAEAQAGSPTQSGAAAALRLPAVRWSAAGVACALLLRSLVVSPPSRLLAGFDWLPARLSTTFGHYLHGALWPFWPEVIMAPKDRSLPQHAVALDAHTWLGAAALAALFALAIVAARRPPLRPWLADTSWFVLPLLPVLNLLPLDLLGLAALRFLYLPLLGLCALLARTLVALPRPRVAVAVLVAWCLALFAVNQVYALAWVNDRALWSYELGHHPERLAAIEGAARLDYNAGAFDRALKHYVTAADIAARRGNHVEELRFTLRAASVLGRRISDQDRASVRGLSAFYRGLREGGDVRLRVADFDRRLRVSKLQAAQTRRDWEWALVPEATVLLKVPDLEAAEVVLRQAAQLEPSRAQAMLMLAQVHGATGQLEVAEEELAEARRRRGGDRRVTDLAGRLQVVRARAPSAATDPLQRAEAALILGIPAEARRLLAAHTELADSRVLWWRLQIGLAMAAGDSATAQAWLERVGREQPQWAQQLAGQ